VEEEENNGGNRLNHIAVSLRRNQKAALCML